MESLFCLPCCYFMLEFWKCVCRKPYHGIFQNLQLLRILCFNFLKKMNNCIFAIFKLTISCKADKMDMKR